MFNKSNITKGMVIHNTNGTDYDVLSVRKDEYGQQDLLLKDKDTNQIVIGLSRDYYGDDESYGCWGQGRYYGCLKGNALNDLIRSFESAKYSKEYSLKKERR